MRRQSILVFALGALLTVSAYAENSAAAPKKAHGAKRAANGPQREARQAAKTQKAAVRALRMDRALESQRPKDYSRDLQVQPSPEIVNGGVLLSESFDVSIPAGSRWIPKGMTVKYLAKAKTDLRAVADGSSVDFSQSGDIVVPVDVFDTDGQKVFTARITMNVKAG